MKLRGLSIAIALLLVVNALVLAGAKYNRSGDPDAAMTLTERELRIAWGNYRENSGITLQINTQHSFYTGLNAIADDSFAWLGRKKLEDIGFDFSGAPRDAKEADYYYKQLPRRVYAVLEYDGPSWAAWEKKLTDELVKVDQAAAEGKRTKQELDTARKNIERARTTDPHLFIIDVGRDPEALRRQYPDRQRYLILASKVHVSYYGSYPAPGMKGDNLRGYVEILSSEVNVPHRLHARLGKQKQTDSVFRIGGIPESGPRYRVVLHTGKRYEPWIEDIVPIQ